MSVLSVPCIVCECGDDDDVFVVKFSVSDCVKCLCESECWMGCDVEVSEVFVQ